MQNIKKFIQLATQYPLLYLEFKNEKEERAVIKVLEEFYALTAWDSGKGNVNTIAEARDAFRTFYVMEKMKQSFPVKQEYCENMVDSLQESCKIAFNEIQMVRKKHQKLNDYFKHTFTMKPSDFKQECSQWKYDNLGDNK